MTVSHSLVLSHIHHDFDGKSLFCDLTLSVNHADVVAIVGTSGVGKTTLFNIAAGLIRPKAGQVILHGQERTGQAGHVGYMLQKDLLLPFKSVYDNITLPLTLSHTPKTLIKERVAPLLTSFGLDGLTHKYPHQLSGGQRQRAALLRTYLSNDKLMLLDEPFSALDYVTKHQMYEWFNQFREQMNLTCLIITHDIDEAMYLSNQLYILKGSPANLCHHFTLPKDHQFTQSSDYLSLKHAILQAMQSS